MLASLRRERLCATPLGGRRNVTEPPTVHPADGQQLFLGARHAGTYFWSGVDLAGALSRPFTGRLAGRHAICGPRQLAKKLGGVRAAAAGICSRTDPRRPRARVRIQDAALRGLQQPAVAIDAARGEPRELPSRAGHDIAAATGREADANRFDAFLSRARGRGERVTPTILLKRK